MGKKRTIDIYGAGCDKFFRTVKSFRDTARKSNIAWEVREITNGKEIAAQGITNLPAVFIDHKLVTQGRGISGEKAGELLRAAL